MKGYNILKVVERVKDGEELNLKINTSFEEIENTVNALKAEIEKPVADFLFLKQTCLHLISRLPLPIFTYGDTFILRCRPNYNGEVYSKIAEINYNPNQDQINLNRFNLKGEPAFYGAPPISSDKANGALTTICESFKELFEENSNLNYQYLTIGKWNVVKPINLIMLTFYDAAWKKSSHIQNINPVFTNYLGLSCNEEDNKKCQLFFGFFSEFAGKRFDTENHYLLTTAFFHALKEQYGKEIGILYSSAGTENYGLNIVLSKEILDNNYLELNHVIMYKIERNPSNRKDFRIYPCSIGSDVNAKGEYRLTGIL